VRDEPSAPVWRTSAFWVGGAVVGLVVAALATVILVATSGDDQPATPAAAVSTPDAGDAPTAEELEKQFAERDRQQIKQMTEQARDIADGLAPPLRAFGSALRDGGTPSPASSQWLDKARKYAAMFQESESGETATNVARAALRASLDGFVSAIEIYRLPGDREAIIERAREQRDIAIRTWSAASIQLDAINIDAGFGHQHVPQLGGESAGGIPPDSLPEGTDAHEE
jgi:hypothetical protein